MDSCAGEEESGPEKERKREVRKDPRKDPPKKEEAAACLVKFFATLFPNFIPKRIVHVTMHECTLSFNATRRQEGRKGGWKGEGETAEGGGGGGRGAEEDTTREEGPEGAY